jgi:hypothetical protein
MKVAFVSNVRSQLLQQKSEIGCGLAVACVLICKISIAVPAMELTEVGCRS